jgi:hypothetical protein
MSKPNKDGRLQAKRYPFVKEHVAVTANGSVKLFKAVRRCLIERIDYINPTGLAADATNAFRLEIKNGSSLVATIANTDSDDVPAGAAITANTFITATNGTKTLRTLAADDVLDITFTEDGTASLPAGTVIVYYTELS